jgi:hypothetical protein
MPILAVITGLVLVLLGVLGYALTSTKSLTAFIPSVSGLLLLASPRARKPCAATPCTLAAGVSLLGLLGTLSGLVTLTGSFFGGTLERPVAVIAQGLTALVCLLFLIFAVRSFVAARRQRRELGPS